MSSDLERVSSLSSATTAVNNSTGSTTGGGIRALSANVRKLHHALNSLLDDFEREQFIHCLNVYHAKRNVFDLVQTLKVILDTAGKRQLLPMLRLVIPRSDQLLFDQYTSEGLYLRTDSGAESFGDSMGTHVPVATATHFISPHHDHQPLAPAIGTVPSVLSTTADGTVPLAPLMPWFGEMMRQVTLTRSKSHEGLGFSIRGGSEHGVGIYVSLVEPGSSAEREGLHVGDQIVTVNDMLFDRVTHIEAVKVLKGCKRLAMSVCSVGCIPGGYMTNHVYSWVDPRGRSVSPPPDMPDGNRRFHAMEERTVNLNMDDGRSLGLMIRGGAEYGLGIYITGVDPGSAADVGALKVGDQILEVNGCSFITISHDEAVHILKMGHQLLMRVRDVGRLPHARTVVDETKWINSPPIAESAATAANSANICNSVCGSANASASSTRPSSARATPVLGKPQMCRGVGPPGSQVFLEEQAYLLLTEPERQTMVYYVQQYQEGHIGVEPLTMALFELFNTHAKLSLLSEVRSLVAPQELELYDGLVLRRDRETREVWHEGPGVLYPQSHCVHQASTGHTSPSQNDISVGGKIGEDLEESTNALQNVTLEELQCSCDHPLSFKPLPSHGQARPSSSMREPTRRLHSARPGQSASGMSFTGPTRLFQDCLHRPAKSLPGTHQASSNSTHHICPNAARHTSLTSLRHTCQSSPYLPTSDHHHHQQQQQQAHSAHHHHNQHLSLHNRPSSGRHTCPGFLHHRESASPPRPEAPVKQLSSRTSSYEKSSIQARSAASSNAATPMASPHLSPHPSPCPSPCPSLIVPPPPPCSPKQPLSPSPNQKGIVGADTNRLTADGRTQPQQRGATLSQLSDSGQTLSEDSGVDIAEAGGLSKDGSPRPTKGQQGQPEPPGYPVSPQTSRQTGSPGPVLSPVLVRVAKNANTLGIAIEGGANTRQPMPRIVTIQKGGSAHRCGQLKVGQVILEVNGVSLSGREHKDVARIIAEAFKTKEKDHIDFLVAEINHAHLPGH